MVSTQTGEAETTSGGACGQTNQRRGRQHARPRTARRAAHRAELKEAGRAERRGRRVSPTVAGFEAAFRDGGYDGIAEALIGRHNQRMVRIVDLGRCNAAHWSAAAYELSTAEPRLRRAGSELFTSSSDGGKTWSPAVEVGGSAGTISDTEWWIDGDLSKDRAGNLYATWDTQSASGDSDIGWLSYSTDRGLSWSAPIRVTPDQDNAVHIV
jgi:hypothetical protein